MTAGFLTFDVAGVPFAVEGSRVEEVAEAVRATRLPFASPQVEGLANVAGRILPVFDLAGPSMPGLAWDDGRKGGSLIVLRAGGGPLALRAGSVGGILPEGRVTRAAPAPEDAGLPVVARLIDGDRSVRLLDPDRLELGRGTVFAEPAEGQGPVAEDTAAPTASAPGRTTVRLLIVEAGGCAHALDMAEILLVFPVAGLRPLPNAPAPVCGMAPVKGRPVLLADPLGAAPGAGGYAVVHETRCGPIGVRVDAVRGAVRFPLDRVTGGVAGAVVEHGGERLEVRTATRMLGDHLDVIGGLIPEGGDLAGHRLPRRFHRRFLAFLVGGCVYALEFEKVRRVIELFDHLRLPREEGGESGGFDGLTGVDGIILPVLDLRRLLACNPVGEAGPDRGVAILVEIGGGTVAVIADSIQRIRKVVTDEVDPLGDRLTAAVIRLDGALVPVLRPEGLLAKAGALPAVAPLMARAGR